MFLLEMIVLNTHSKPDMTATCAEPHSISQARVLGMTRNHPTRSPTFKRGSQGIPASRLYTFGDTLVKVILGSARVVDSHYEIIPPSQR